MTIKIDPTKKLSLEATDELFEAVEQDVKSWNINIPNYYRLALANCFVGDMLNTTRRFVDVVGGYPVVQLYDITQYQPCLFEIAKEEVTPEFSRQLISTIQTFLGLRIDRQHLYNTHKLTRIVITEIYKKFGKSLKNALDARIEWNKWPE